MGGFRAIRDVVSKGSLASGLVFKGLPGQTQEEFSKGPLGRAIGKFEPTPSIGEAKELLGKSIYRGRALDAGLSGNISGALSSSPKTLSGSLPNIRRATAGLSPMARFSDSGRLGNIKKALRKKQIIP